MSSQGGTWVPDDCGDNSTSENRGVVGEKEQPDRSDLEAHGNGRVTTDQGEPAMKESGGSERTMVPGGVMGSEVQDGAHGSTLQGRAGDQKPHCGLGLVDGGAEGLKGDEAMAGSGVVVQDFCDYI